MDRSGCGAGLSGRVQDSMQEGLVQSPARGIAHCVAISFLFNNCKSKVQFPPLKSIPYLLRISTGVQYLHHSQPVLALLQLLCSPSQLATSSLAIIIPYVRTHTQTHTPLHTQHKLLHPLSAALVHGCGDDTRRISGLDEVGVLVDCLLFFMEWLPREFLQPHW